jgi:hypothetical protein
MKRNEYKRLFFVTRNDEVFGSIPTNGSIKTGTYSFDCRCLFL